MKVKVNLSLSEDTAERLKELAEKEHKTVSQWVTDRVWGQALSKDGEEDAK